MDPIDKFLKLYSYKFNKGYPDMNDEQDILLMESILKEEFDIELVEKNVGAWKTQWAKFPKKGPYKEDNKNRLDILKIKIKNGEEIEFETGEKIVIDPAVLDDAGFKNWIKTGEGTRGHFNFKEFGIDKSTSAIEKTFDFGGEDPDTLKSDTDVKEGLVVVFHDLIANTLPDEVTSALLPFDKNTPDNNAILFDQYLNIGDVTQVVADALGGKVATKLKNYLEKAEKSPGDKTMTDVINNAFSIGNSLASLFPNSKIRRDDKFNSIRTQASKATGLDQDKWNPGDIYISTGDNSSIIDDAIKKSQETSPPTIAPINQLFNNDLNKTNSPLTAISLKDEKAQPGRAKGYLERFGKEAYKLQGDVDLNSPIEDIEKEIKTYRNKFSKIKGTDTTPIVYKQEPGKKVDNPELNKRRKLAAFKMLDYLSKQSKNLISPVLGMFAYGEGLDQDKRANPTFFKFTGQSDGSTPSIEKYPAGATVEFVDGQPLIIKDSLTSGGITLEGVINIEGGKGNKKTSRSFRSSDSNPGASLGIV
jgi:hypothetical protein